MKRAQDGVRIHTEYGGEILCRRQSVTRRSLSRRNRAANLGGDLIVKRCRIRLIDADRKHGHSNTMTIMVTVVNTLATADTCRGPRTHLSCEQTLAALTLGAI